MRDYFVEDMRPFQNLTNTVLTHVSERQRLLQSDEKAMHSKEGRKDMLAKLFNLHHTRGVEVDFGFYDILQEGISGVFAGSDTTSIAMRAIIHQLLTHPPVLERLRRELDQAIKEGRLSIPVVYSDAIKLPYLCACFKEAMRLHPSVGLTLPRYVPVGGCEMNGYFFPEGVTLGINPAVLHYQSSVFGSDASEFKPERWLQEESGGLDKYLLTFGGGSRTCIGKNVSFSSREALEIR